VAADGRPRFRFTGPAGQRSQTDEHGTKAQAGTLVQAVAKS